MLYMIDNYDSFTYNLVQYFGELGQTVCVARNDAVALEDIQASTPGYVVISPGPCTPDQAGISIDVVRHFAGRIPLLGVCLGHQCIAQAYGGRIVHARAVMHGKLSDIYHDQRGVFQGLPVPFQATRYHSLVAEKQSLPDALEVSAWTDAGEIMGLRHRKIPLEGVQFHPESIATEHGHRMLANFLGIGPQ